MKRTLFFSLLCIFSIQVFSQNITELFKALPEPYDHNYKDELSPDEARWWLSSAKKEYFHIKDREISYNNFD